MSIDIFCGDMWHMLSVQFLKCPNHFLKKTLTFLNLIFCMNWPLIYIILLLCLREGGSHFISEVTIFLIHKLARHAVSKLIQIKPVLQYLAILCSTGKGYVHYCPHLLGYNVMGCNGTLQLKSLYEMAYLEYNTITMFEGRWVMQITALSTRDVMAHYCPRPTGSGSNVPLHPSCFGQ